MGAREFDESLSQALSQAVVGRPLQEPVFILAAWFVYLAPILLIYLFLKDRPGRVLALKLSIAALLAWQVFSNLLGQLAYNQFGFRDRPFSDFGWQEFLFERPERAFPSDHAAFLAAIALTLFWQKQAKLGWFFLLGALFGSLARVAVGFHYLGDILVGWLLGLAAAWLIWRLEGPLTQFIGWALSKLNRALLPLVGRESRHLRQK